MVSKASELLPLPERPVTTTITSRGIETVMFFRLCSRAPWTTIALSAIFGYPFFEVAPAKVYGPLWGGQVPMCFRRFYHRRPHVLVLARARSHGGPSRKQLP